VAAGLRRFVVTDSLPDTADPQADLEAAALATASRQVLEKCLEGLATHTRLAVLLRYQQSFGYPEMAQLCGEKPATLQARVARAMPVLRRCLEQAGLDA
jgi:DNA-directed RNA polymerase specialized sigma24 family protein